MTTSDYLLNGLLVALVLRQIRPSRLTPRLLLLPVGLVCWAATHYLHGVPTAGNDLVLVIGGALIGAVLGTGAGLLTTITKDADGTPIVRATAWAAALWILGVGSRVGFSLYSDHGGANHIAHFSAVHSITSSEAWVAGLVLMALAEVLSRTTVLAFRSGYVARWVSRSHCAAEDAPALAISR